MQPDKKRHLVKAGWKLGTSESFLDDVSPVKPWRGDPLTKTTQFCSRAGLHAEYGQFDTHHGQRPIWVCSPSHSVYSGYSDADWGGVGLTTSRVMVCMVSELGPAVERCSRPGALPGSVEFVARFIRRLRHVVDNLEGLVAAVQSDLGTVPHGGELAEALNEVDLEPTTLEYSIRTIYQEAI